MRAIKGSSCKTMLELLNCLLVLSQNKKKKIKLSLIQEKAFEDSKLVGRLIWHL